MSWKVAHADFEGLDFALTTQSTNDALTVTDTPVAPPSDRFAAVSFASAQSRLVIARIAQRSTTHASSRYGNANLTEGGSDDLFMAPCEVRLDPALHELVARADRFTRHGNGRPDRRLPARFDAREGSKAVRSLGGTASAPGMLGILAGSSVWMVEGPSFMASPRAVSALHSPSDPQRSWRAASRRPRSGGRRWKVAPSLNPRALDRRPPRAL